MGGSILRVLIRVLAIGKMFGVPMRENTRYTRALISRDNYRCRNRVPITTNGPLNKRVPKGPFSLIPFGIPPNATVASHPVAKRYIMTMSYGDYHVYRSLIRGLRVAV